MHWYKVTFDAQGKITSCQQLQAPSNEQVSGVVYIQARSPEEAATGAVRLQERIRTRERRARYRREGKCHCSAVLEAGDAKVCKRCLRLQQKALERRLTKSLGIPTEEKTRRDTMEEGRREKLAAADLQVLLEVQRAWERAPTVAVFAEWLRRRLEQAGGGAEKAKVGTLNIEA